MGSEGGGGLHGVVLVSGGLGYEGLLALPTKEKNVSNLLQ